MIGKFKYICASRTLSKLLFVLVLVVLPVNLGKHFEQNFSYVNGLLVDYLVPTIFVQDILVLGLVLFWLVEDLVVCFSTVSFFRCLVLKLRAFFSHGFVIAGVLFCFSIFLSALNSRIPFISVMQAMRTTLYFFACMYGLFQFDWQRHKILIRNILAVQLTVLLFWGLLQFIKQGSLFNNYLVLGEQPYSTGTYNINSENIFGVSRVGSYGTFRHPNTFAGYMAILSLLLMSEGLVLFGLLGTFGIILTFSFSALLVMLTFPLLFVVQNRLRSIKLAMFLVILAPLLFQLVNPVFYGLGSSASFVRRNNLAKVSVDTIGKHFLYGVGPSVFTSLGQLEQVGFNQPPHNIFLLLFAESGAISFALFWLFIFLVSNYLPVRNKLLLLALVLLGGWDHYIFTSQQGMLLFYLVGLGYVEKVPK